MTRTHITARIARTRGARRAARVRRTRPRVGLAAGTGHPGERQHQAARPRPDRPGKPGDGHDGRGAERSGRRRDLPASVDLSQWAMPVGDQGQIGSCAAWATDYSAMGYWMNKQNIAGGPLAPMFTYSQYSHTYKGGRDEGSTLDYHPGRRQDHRRRQPRRLPAAGQLRTSRRSRPPRRSANAARWKVSELQYLPVQQSAARRSPRTRSRPLSPTASRSSSACRCTPSFEQLGSANDGFYDPANLGTERGGHAVTAFGYDATGVRVQNQWGTWWGDGGWATLSWDFVNRYAFQTMEVGQLVTADPRPSVVSQPDGRRRHHPRRNADCEHGHLHRQPDQLRLPVAAREQRHRRCHDATYVTTAG